MDEDENEDESEDENENENENENEEKENQFDPKQFNFSNVKYESSSKFFESEILVLYDRIKMTNLREINRKRGTPFDMEELVAISNDALTSLDQEVLIFEQNYSLLSSRETFTFKLLREIIDLRITLNEYGKAYVCQVKKRKAIK